MNRLAVPAAAPRSDGLAVAKIAEKNAGVLNATPTAVRTVPAIIPPGVVQAAMALATPGTQVRSRSVRSSQTVRKANRVIAMSSPKISAASCENAVHPRC